MTFVLGFKRGRGFRVLVLPLGTSQEWGWTKGKKGRTNKQQSKPNQMQCNLKSPKGDMHEMQHDDNNKRRKTQKARVVTLGMLHSLISNKGVLF